MTRVRFEVPARRTARRLLPTLAVLGIIVPSIAGAADPVIDRKLKGFDAYLEAIVKDWNVPGLGVGVVAKDRLVFARGYGFRDFGRRLPFTPKTTVPIASNTKLFTAVATGLLVEDGKLDWDKPVRQFVPDIQFFNDDLSAKVTIRDMLSHRTGITRHDTIWYKSDFTRKELFERLKYLEPSQPMRQTFLYNNMMYAGAGYVIELLSGKTWEDFVRELLNPAYGMGRFTASYRGHLLTYHGGDINGFHSQVSSMPNDGFGVIVLVIGDHAAPLYNVVSYNAYERLLGMDLTPWSERALDIRLKSKDVGKQARAKAGGERVAGTKPSHPLEDYVGEYEHPAYGVLTIAQQDAGLLFDFHKIRLPLTHFHYDRFDTPDDEQDGKWSVNFSTNPQGEIDKAVLSLDEAEVSFVRRIPATLFALETLRPYAGTYETPTGAKFEVLLTETGVLGLAFPGQAFHTP